MQGEPSQAHTQMNEYHNTRIAEIVLQHTVEGVAVTDAAGTILWINPAFKDQDKQEQARANRRI